MELWIILLLLGAVQGISEFLPISSSGHLIVIEQMEPVRAMFQVLGEEVILAVNVGLHLATLLAVVVFLRRDIVAIVKGFFTGLFSRNFGSAEFRIAVYTIIATVPAVAAGLVFKDFFDSFFSSAYAVFILLIINGIILVLTKIIPVNGRNIEEMGPIKALAVGMCQAVAILPGISRSGMTIAGGMLLGLKPVESARFSFLMSIAVIAGAGLYEGLHAVKGGVHADVWAPMACSMALTFVVALISLKLLVALVSRIKLHLFGYYTIAVGALGIIAKMVM